MTILLVQRASINFYPPVINQANIMAEAGFSVKVLDGGSDIRPSGLHPNVELIRPLAQTPSDSLNSRSKIKQAVVRLLDNAQYANVLKKEQQKITDSFVRIAYDSPAIALMGASRYADHTICHFHEHPEACPPSVYLNLQHKIARLNARRVNTIVIPDKHRAMALRQEEHLSHMPYIVPNCPRPLKSLPVGNLRPKVLQQIPSTKYIVLFQGAISENYYADKIVSSMPWWPQEATMVFLGPVHQFTKERLLQLAQDSGVIDRLLFFPQVEYAQLFSYTVDADLALSMIKPVTFNFTHMAGASNKRYEFMACGVPQISNIGPGMRELIEDNEVGLCVNPEDVRAIGCNVKNLLLDESYRKFMGEKARQLHLRKYNYDLQFTPVLNLVRSIQAKF